MSYEHFGIGIVEFMVSNFTLNLSLSLSQFDVNEYFKSSMISHILYIVC